MGKRVHGGSSRHRILGCNDTVMAASEIHPKIFKMKNLLFIKRMSGGKNIEENSRMIRVSAREMAIRKIFKEGDPVGVSKITIKPGPSSGEASMAITPGEARPNEAKVNKIIFKDKIGKKGSFRKIVAKRTTTMICSRNNGIEIPSKEPRNVKRSHTRQAFPGKILKRKHLRVVNN